MTEPQTEAAWRAKAELILEAWADDPDRDAAQMARAVVRLLDREAQARQAALAEVRRGVEGLDRNRGLVALDEVGAILDAAETP